MMSGAVPVADGDCLVRNPQRVTYSYEHHPLKAVTAHNARHQRGPDSQCLFASVPKVRGLSLRNRPVFWVDLPKATVLKTVASANVKSRSAKYLISVTLNVRGEVAESLKAAVC
jgi:hypothetical protein